MTTDASRWRRCSSCKEPIAFGAAFWECSVSTCNRPRTGLAFCSTSCWDAHLGVVPHRESFAVERRAPSRAEWEREQAGAAPAPAERAEREPRRILPAQPSAPPAVARAALPDDVLIVMSKLKAYVRARAGMNTSDRVADPLSDAVRRLCDRAIENARREGRRTVLERDFE